MVLGHAGARGMQLAAADVEAVQLVRQVAGVVHALGRAVGVLDGHALALVDVAGFTHVDILHKGCDSEPWRECGWA